MAATEFCAEGCGGGGGSVVLVVVVSGGLVWRGSAAVVTQKFNGILGLGLFPFADVAGVVSEICKSFTMTSGIVILCRSKNAKRFHRDEAILKSQFTQRQ